MPLVSVVIRTKNEERYIGEVLGALLRQEIKDFEVIIVDSGSTDRTLEIVRRYDIKLIQMKPEEFTFGRALNMGASAAKGKYVVNLSAHAIPVNSKYLHKLIGNFKGTLVAGVYGKQIPLSGTNLIEVKDYLDGYSDVRKVQTTDCFFSNSNASVRMDIWEKIPFNETFTGSEDWDWAKRAQKLGYQIIYEPEAAVYHSHKEKLLQIYRRAKREAIGMKRIEMERNLDIKNACLNWKNSVKEDYRYLRKNKAEFYWFIYSPLNRLAKTCGYYNGYKEGSG